MSISIRDPEAGELARELAAARKTNMTEAIIFALREALRHERAKRPLEERLEKLAEKAAAMAGPNGRIITKEEIDEGSVICEPAGLVTIASGGSLDEFLREASIREIPLGPVEGSAAVGCFETFGKSRHPARLNFADCLVHACAKGAGARPLYKGDDFAKTDADAWL